MENDNNKEGELVRFFNGETRCLSFYAENGIPNDYRIFQECLDEDGRLRFGQWDYLTVLAWVGSRDEAFTAGVQRFCNQESISPYWAGPFWGAARLVIADAMAKANWSTSYDEAVADLREALEGERLRGTALREKDGERATVSGDEWRRGFDEVSHYNSFSLVAGYCDHLWLSHDVVSVFPGSEAARIEAGTVINPYTEELMSHRAKLPAHAKPTHKKHEEYAHEAAMLVRSGKATSLQDACRSVAPEETMRDPASVVRAIRAAYDLMYDKRGLPINN